MVNGVSPRNAILDTELDIPRSPLKPVVSQDHEEAGLIYDPNRDTGPRP